MVLSQPYIYAPPKRYSEVDPYSGFDPRAVTRASLVPRVPQRLSTADSQFGRQSQQGPLLNFNKHPDSWGSLNYVPQYPTEPMPSSTKKKIKFTRYFQLLLRVLQFVCAIGVMFCVIVIKNTADTEGIVIRVPAAVDLLVTGYAIVHLFRAAKSRTPSSSASYHFFSLVIDLALIPFYVYICLAARNNLALSESERQRWTTFFSSEEATNLIIQVTWLVCVTTAGLHAVSLLVSGFLFVLFRRISLLPPDLNPLEDNLTSRRKSKHKHKSSEVISEKHTSTSSLGNSIYTGTSSGRSSPNKAVGTSAVKPVSFLHTRQDSDTVYSPHNPATASASRADLSGAPVGTYARLDDKDFTYVDLRDAPGSSHSSETLGDGVSNRSHTFLSEPSSHLPTFSNSSAYSGPLNRGTIPPLPRKSSKREGPMTESENWTLQDENMDPARVSIVEEEVEDGIAATMSHFGLDAFRRSAYQPLQQNGSTPSLALPTADKRHSPQVADSPNWTLQPLRMNPPTPVGSVRNGIDGANSPSPRPLSTTSGNSITTPRKKPKGYGDLSPKPKATPDKSRSAYSESEWMKPAASSYLGVEKRDFAADGKGRVISRSGVDIADAAPYYMHDDTDAMGASLQAGFRGNGLRQVSGKAAEEGMAGQGSWWRRRTSGRGSRAG